MKTQLKRQYPLTLHGDWRVKLAFLFLLVCMLTLLASCSEGEDTFPPVPVLEGKIASYNEFGGAMVDFTAAQMTAAGFTLGDVVTITIGGKEIIAPYYDGYYAPSGDYLFVAYPTYPTICFTANNVGVPEDLRGLEGQPVTVKMKEKGGKLDVQEALSMSYTNDRTNYP